MKLRPIPFMVGLSEAQSLEPIMMASSKQTARLKESCTGLSCQVLYWEFLRCMGLW